jgi:ATP synthase F1 gamma subunit
MQLNELRKELKFETELLSLVETLKNVASAQYHLMEKEKERFDEFMDAFSGFFRVVNLHDVEHPLVRVGTDKVGVIIVTSDSGFMGGLNQGVIRDALEVQNLCGRENIALVIIGDKGSAFVEDRSWDFKFFPGIRQETIYEQAVEISEYIVQQVQAGNMGKVIVGYPRPLSFTSQTVEVINLLPCAELFDKDADTEVARHVGTRRLIADARKVIVESTFKDMVGYLAGVWVTSKLFEVFEDSKLAEFSARAMHLENSVQKVEEMYKKTKRRCFKAAHEQIDKGMRESFAATKGKRERGR